LVRELVAPGFGLLGERNRLAPRLIQRAKIPQQRRRVGAAGAQFLLN